SQFPDDVPDEILGQLGNRVQHALRAFTPRDQKAVRTAAQTFVPNPDLDVVDTIARLGTGEALVSTLQDKGIPMPVEYTVIAPPRCRMGAISDEERARVRAGSPVGVKYDTPVNRESAAEILARRAAEMPAQASAPPAKAKAGEESGGIGRMVTEFLFGTSRRQGAVQAAGKQAVRTVTNRVVRNILGGIRIR
ncbi:MAG: DUF853 family protein, partial [Gammaproteobacteria bacterium]|nr:DUF853 family protein [Gammaproteobacteria bacterium]